MRATWFITAVFLGVVWVPVIVLPVDAWVYVFPVLLSVGAVVGLVFYEKKTRGGHSESRRRALEKALDQRLKASGGAQQLGITTMREDLRDAVSKLTGAMPGSAPRHAIEALPWYLVVGPSQSGKSALLASSGQEFGFVTPASGPQGGRGMRFWLAPHAAYIDTRGDYMTGEGAYAEWLAFLRELEDTRPGQPIHGIIVTLPADTAMQTRPDDLDALGKTVRERVDEALGFMGVDVPVYLAVTRCDTLMGFMEYFSDQRGRERGQVFGFTMPIRGGAKADPVASATRLFDELAHDLQRRMYSRVKARAHEEVRSSTFMFPQWFAAMRPGVIAFAKRLFASNMYMDQVSARGVYFTTAADVTYVAGPEAPYASSPTGERGMFIRDFLMNIVLPDRELARPSASELLRRRHRSLAIAAPMLAGALVVPLLSWHSYTENSALLTEFRSALNDCVVAQPPVPLRKLDVLRARVDRVRSYEVNGPPLDLRMGMYVGNEVQRRMATAYAGLIFREAIQRVIEVTSRDLINFSMRYFNTALAPTNEERITRTDSLRLYLMLTTPRAPDEPSLADINQRNWFDNQVVQAWNNAYPTTDRTVEAARKYVIDLYALVLSDDQRLGYPRDPQLIARVRAILAR